MVTTSATLFSLVRAYNGGLIKCTASTFVTITVPSGLPKGFTVTLLQSGTGLVVPAAGSGVTFITGAVTRGVGSSVFLHAVDADTYMMYLSLTEPVAAQNLLLASEDLAGAAWSESNITKDSATGFTVTSGGTNGLSQTVSVVPGVAYVFSFTAKRGTLDDPQYAVYDVTNAAYIVAATDYSSQVPDGLMFWPVVVPFATPAGCVSARLDLNRNSADTGTSYVARMQLSMGAAAKTYCATTSAVIP